MTETIHNLNKNTQNFQSEKKINKKKINEIEIININETVSHNSNINKDCIDISEINKDFVLPGLNSIIMDNNKKEIQEQQQEQQQEIYIEDSDDSIEDEDNFEIENQKYLEDFNSLQNNGNITPVKAITFFIKKKITLKKLKNTYKNCNQELNKKISFDTFCKICQMIET